MHPPCRRLVATLAMRLLLPALAAALLAGPGGPAAAGVLRIADFDASGARADVGAIALDTHRGVLASANGAPNDGWSFMVFDRSLPLHVVEIFGEGRVAFGYVERVYWTPGAWGRGDLVGEGREAPADRVYAVVDAWGRVELRSARAGSAGVLIARGSVDLRPELAFGLELDVAGRRAVVLYGGRVVASGNPFAGAPDAADPTRVGDDMVVSIGHGRSARGGAVITNAPLPIAGATEPAASGAHGG